MSTPNHRDLAEQAFNATALPPPPRTLAQALTFIERLLGMLPADEKAGYVKGPRGGENVWPLADGTLVRISRVMYPDGQIVKVLSDAPNGKPQWVLEDVRPELYVPMTGNPVPNPGTPPTEEVDLAPVLAEITLLKQLYQLLLGHSDELAKQIDAINKTIERIDGEVVKKPLPEYAGKASFWGGTVVSKPR